MTMSPDQKSAFEQLKEHIPADLIPGYSVSSAEVDPESVWVKRMSRFSKDLGLNAYAYFNYTARSNGPLKRNRRAPKKVLSPEGFPPWINISYVYPPPRAFYSLANERVIKHFVIHSFGHMWHASYNEEGKKVGWMNKRGVTPYVLEGRTVYIAKGSDSESLAHFTRFSAGLRSCLSSAATASANFFIDRAGNLIVVGNCNDVMFTSQGLNKTSCGVELEEAFYVLKDTKGKGNKAVWKSGGNPPGTAGNIEYFAYSAQQLLTLSILAKKLEFAYAPLRERNVEFKRKSFRPTSPPGYTMHDYLYPGVYKKDHPKGWWKKGEARPGHMDVSPHFRTQEFWDSFFKLMDTHKQINRNNVWKPTQKYADSNASKVVVPLSSTPVTAMTERVLNQIKTTGLAQQRTQSIANTTRREINNQAGTAATKESLRVSQRVATVSTATQQTQSPPTDYMNNVIGVGSNGQQIGSDDEW